MDGRIAAKALWIVGQAQAEIRPESIDPPGDGAVLVTTLFSGVSRGTERLVAEGRVPESARGDMRAPFQAGDFPFPVKYGYAAVGVVTHGPQDLQDLTVFCLHPHQDRFVVPATAVHPVPAAVPPARAVLAANMETALTIVWDAEIAPGDRVAVIGAGVVGLLCAHIARSIAGTDVTLVDVDPAKKAVADDLGLSFRLADAAPVEQDVVIHASASEAGLRTAIGCAAFEGLIVEASWYGDRTVSVPLGGRFHSHRLRIVSSQVGHVPAGRSRRWPYSRRLAVALSLLSDPRLDRLVAARSPFETAAEDHPRVVAAPDTLCHVYQYFR